MELAPEDPGPVHCTCTIKQRRDEHQRCYEAQTWDLSSTHLVFLNDRDEELALIRGIQVATSKHLKTSVVSARLNYSLAQTAADLTCNYLQFLLIHCADNVDA